MHMQILPPSKTYKGFNEGDRVRDGEGREGLISFIGLEAYTRTLCVVVEIEGASPRTLIWNNLSDAAYLDTLTKIS